MNQLDDELGRNGRRRGEPEEALALVLGEK
jgi:hypothetical protein